MKLQRSYSSTSLISVSTSPGDQIFVLVGKDPFEINSHKDGYWQILIIHLCHKTLTYEILGDTFWKNGCIKIVRESEISFRVSDQGLIIIGH